ncbi:hypothetical protein ABT354_30630 [Streptomyces sp. NPDC000594]|uniref:hypothetical protein n=1 Tax=Streptomyces sp. NPDC000594 TaxID=3154261 RepID=UPI00331B4241
MRAGETMRIGVTHHLYVITHTDAEEPDDDRTTGNGLVWLNEEGDQANIMTGTSWGDINVTVEIHDTEPEPELIPWDEAVEFSMRFTRDGPMIGSLITEDLTDLPIPSGEGDDRPWRLRLHARGRDTATTLGDRPVLPDGTLPEHHLIQLWPAPQTPENRLKLTDRTGARSRAT